MKSLWELLWNYDPNGLIVVDRDLIVRVAGYSAFFNVLSRQTQDDIIARTEQAL